uniref:Uncharacterized protein n=1 Tax=Tetraselmis sp. GSL018 TaxID=582737 RepID=A0A061S535_9CHLO
MDITCVSRCNQALALEKGYASYRSKLPRLRFHSISLAAATHEVEYIKEKTGRTQGYPNLVNNLLKQAASRIERGETHCLHCKGKGYVPCHTCRGTGIAKPEKVKVHNSLERAFETLHHTVYNQATDQGQDFKVTNRCCGCHGRGKQVCGCCRGSGRRGPA